MLRVAYLFERFPSFGQTFCYREVAELERQGAEVAVFSIRRPTGEPAQDWDAAIVRRVFYLPAEDELVRETERAIRSGELPEAAARKLREWDRQSDFLRLHQATFVGLRLRKAGIERVHAHFAGMAARTAYWIREFFGIEFSLTAHANDIFAPKEFAVSLEKIFDAATAIVTVSDFAVAQLRERFPRNGAKIYRVYNGINPEAFLPAKFDGPIPLIASVGRLIEKKGFSDLVRACLQLREEGWEFRCEIVGEGPLAATLAAQISELGLEQTVKLSGPHSQQEIARLLQAATVFVLPCTREADGGMDNLPTVIMEAMASGLPVISTPLAGVPEMVTPGVSGELVAERDPATLAHAISRILDDPARAKELGKRGREIAREKFSIESNVKSLTEILGKSSRA